MKLTGIEHKLSTAYHPQTDGMSECSNKTIVQCLWFHVKHNQKEWAKVLPKVRFDIMNSMNTLTGVSPFILKMEQSPQLLPPLITAPPNETTQPITTDEVDAWNFIENMEEETHMVKDNLLTAKIQQAHFANRDWLLEPAFNIGDKVMLNTAHRWRDYICAKDGCVAKFMLRFDGPYEITQAFLESSSYKLLLPSPSKSFSIFHVMQL